jgi:hypothetical protein
MVYNHHESVDQQISTLTGSEKYKRLVGGFGIKVRGSP